MSDRGDYRSFYVSLADDPDFHALSGNAVKLLLVLRLELSAAGIGVVYSAKLRTQLGDCSTKRLEDAFVELERPKQSSTFGWIVRERNVVWIVNALRFEPTLSADNPKHRKFIARLLAPLDTKMEIVRRFCARYPQWVPHTVSDTLSNGYRKGLEGVSDHSPRPSSPSHSGPSRSDDVDVARNSGAEISTVANANGDADFAPPPLTARFAHARAETQPPVTNVTKALVDATRQAGVEDFSQDWRNEIRKPRRKTAGQG